jgi:hypothetical protein
MTDSDSGDARTAGAVLARGDGLMPLRPPMSALALLLSVGAASAWFAPLSIAQNQTSAIPTARLLSAATVRLPSDVDSNSPAVWERVDGLLRLFVLTSVSGLSVRTEGADITRLVARQAVTFTNQHPGHGVWFEAIVPDVDGTWYGFYHHERPTEMCNDRRAIPRIGAARSSDFGATWEDLGIVLESPPGTYDCASANRYFLGGVGDFSVMLDANSQYLYVFFSQYADLASAQGVSVARLAWADRDAPAGKVSVWLRNQTWLPARSFRTRSGERHVYPAGMPIYRVSDEWHDDVAVDAFWGPSVHWNTYLGQYVMLLNHAVDASWRQEGIYVSFSPTLSEPNAWSYPTRLVAGGRWYPQVIGTEIGVGTDRIAGERARLFISGRSDHIIQFVK